MPRSEPAIKRALGGGSQAIHIDNANGSSIFDIIAGTGESYVSAQGGFDDFKQLRVVFAPAAVPEPATWGMMLLGFAGIGMTISKRRTNTALMRIA